MPFYQAIKHEVKQLPKYFNRGMQAVRYGLAYATNRMRRYGPPLYLADRVRQRIKRAFQEHPPHSHFGRGGMRMFRAKRFAPRRPRARRYKKFRKY